MLLKRSARLAYRARKAAAIRGALPRLARSVITDPTPSASTNNALNTSEDVIQWQDEREEERNEQRRRQKKDQKGAGAGKGKRDWGGTAFKTFEAGATTGISIFMLGLTGYSYDRYYKANVLQKIEDAFAPGDPALVTWNRTDDRGRDHWIERVEQSTFDEIVAGNATGSYHLIVGEKGTGKTTMLLDAMAKIDGEGCAMFEAHSDNEIFRIRLGRALNFEFHEDNVGALFSIRGPREGSPLLDIERAFNKLEKVAITRRQQKGKPLIIIIDKVHHIKDDEEGLKLLEMLQQRAEKWAISNLGTFIFNSDDFWVYQNLKQDATRMKIHSITDLNRPAALHFLRENRKEYFKDEEVDPDVFAKVYWWVGGRLSHLDQVAKSPDMLKMCRRIVDHEKQWYQDHCAIYGMDSDDDVMDEQKFAMSAAFLMAYFVKQGRKKATFDPDQGHILPSARLNKARHIMTRADFAKGYDKLNIFTTDYESNVRFDSVAMWRAAEEIVDDDFLRLLDETNKRIGDIESLGRTRELTIKDLWGDGRYEIKRQTEWKNGCHEHVTTMQTVPRTHDGDDDDDDDDDGDDDD